MFHRSREQGAGSGRTRRALLPALSSLLLVSFGCSRDHRTPLVIYSPHGRDLLTLFERRFEALHPDIDVRWLDMGSQDVYDRVRSERANPQADVWFGGPSLILAPASRDSLLDCHRPSWADAIAARGNRIRPARPVAIEQRVTRGGCENQRGPTEPDVGLRIGALGAYAIVHVLRAHIEPAHVD